MAFWNRATTLVAHADALAEATPTVPGVVPSWTDFQAMRSLWAMQVPAYRRGHMLITGNVAKLPLRADTAPPTRVGLLTQPERGSTRWVTMQRLARDLVNRGRGYWVIETPVTGYRVRRLDADSTTEQPDGTITGSDGHTYTRSDPSTPPVAGQVIVFDGYAEGALDAGVDVLATALALELTARNYAETPHPGDVLENVSGYEMDDEEVQTMLDKWRAARQAGAAAYTNSGVKLADAKGWSPTELALADQRNQSAIQVARLLGLDAIWVSAAVGGSSLTYTNRVDLRQELYGTLTDYLAPIEERLSMPDVLGVPARFDASEFLRANLSERVTMAVALVGAGIITTEQAARFVSDASTGGPA